MTLTELKREVNATDVEPSTIDVRCRQMSSLLNEAASPKVKQCICRLGRIYFSRAFKLCNIVDFFEIT